MSNVQHNRILSLLKDNTNDEDWYAGYDSDTREDFRYGALMATMMAAPSRQRQGQPPRPVVTVPAQNVSIQNSMQFNDLFADLRRKKCTIPGIEISSDPDPEGRFSGYGVRLGKALLVHHHACVTYLSLNVDKLLSKATKNTSTLAPLLQFVRRSRLATLRLQADEGSRHHLTMDMVGDLLRAVADNTSTTTLDLSDSDVRMHVPDFAHVLQTTTSLTTLSLNVHSWHFDDVAANVNVVEHCRPVVVALGANTTLTHVTFISLLGPDPIFAPLLEQLGSHATVTELTLHLARLDPTDLVPLATLLHTTKSIRVLHIKLFAFSKSPLTPAQLLDVLHGNTSVTEITMEHERMRHAFQTDVAWTQRWPVDTSRVLPHYCPVRASWGELDTDVDFGPPRIVFRRDTAACAAAVAPTRAPVESTDATVPAKAKVVDDADPTTAKRAILGDHVENAKKKACLDDAGQ